MDMEEEKIGLSGYDRMAVEHFILGHQERITTDYILDEGKNSTMILETNVVIHSHIFKKLINEDFDVFMDNNGVVYIY